MWLKRWRKGLISAEKIQVAYMGVINFRNSTPHYHLVMFGRNKDGKTLLDVNVTYWQNYWNGLAKISLYDTSLNTSAYLLKDYYMKCARASEWIVFNQRLLRKHQTH